MSLNIKCFALPIPWSQEVNGTLRLMSLCWEPFFLRLPNPSSRLKGAINQLTRYVSGRPPVTKDYWRRFSPGPFCHRVWSPKHTQTHPFIWLKVKMTNRIIKSTAMNSLMFIKLLTHPNKKQKKPAEFITWNHPLIRPKTPERRMVFCNTCGGIAVRPESQRVWLATHLQLQLLKDVIGIAWQLTKHPKKTLQAKQKHFLLQNPSSPFVVKHSVAEQNHEKFQSKSSQKKVGPDWCQGHQSVRRDPLDFGAWRITEAAATPLELG